MNAYPTKPQTLDFALDSFNSFVDPLRKGSTFKRTLVLEDFDLTGHRLRMSVRETYSSPLVLFFDSDETLTTKERIEIEISDNNSIVDLIVPTAVSETLDVGSDTSCVPRRKIYKYDMEIVTPSGEVYPFLEGSFHIIDEITTEA